MKEQSPKSIIPEHIVEYVTHNFDTQGTPDYMRNTNFEMQERQPELHKQLMESAVERGGNNGLSYMFGALLSFNVIATWLHQEGKEILITEEDLEVHWENVIDFSDDPRWWHDPTWTEEQLAAGNTPKSDLSLVEKLNIYSPSFKIVLVTISDLLSTYELKSAFLSGVRDTALPFFAKIEAEELDKKLYQ